MRFIDALEAGRTEFDRPDTIVTTKVSKLFIFGEKVLKVYKHETFFFADLLNFESRKAFYTEDFFWNNTAAPEIYLHLWGVREEGDSFALVPVTMGEDFAIEMSKIDDTEMLTKLLLSGRLSKEQAGAFVDSLVDTLATLTKERRAQLHHLFAKGLSSIMQENISSLYEWMRGQDPNVPSSFSEEVRSVLSAGLRQESYFHTILSEELSAAIDNNCDNLILLKEKPSFIDIMPPMEVWRVVDEYATVSRLIVDAEVLGTRELGDAARAAYAKYGRQVPPIVRLMHELRAACIQWPYRYMLGQDEIAERYGAYAKVKLEELKALL